MKSSFRFSLHLNMIYDSYLLHRLIWKILRAYGYLGNQEVTIAEEIFNLWRVIRNPLKILSGRMKFISSQNVFETVIGIAKITPNAPLHISLIIMQNPLFPLTIQQKSSNILTCFLQWSSSHTLTVLLRLCSSSSFMKPVTYTSNECYLGNPVFVSIILSNI